MKTSLTEVAWIRLYEIFRRHSVWTYALSLDQSQWYTLDEIVEIQITKMQNVLKHAYERVPYYRWKFSKAGFDPNKFECMSQMEEIPPLRKREVQENYLKLMAQNYNHSYGQWSSTGGTTGGPTRFFVGTIAAASKIARDLRYTQWYGFNIGQPYVKLWGADKEIMSSQSIPRLIRRKVTNVLELNTWTMNPQTMNQFIKRIKKFKPVLVEAYARSLFLLADFALVNNLSDGLQMTSVISAEGIPPKEREVVEAVFGLDVYNRYGSREFGNMAQECKKHQGMHISAESIILESIESSKGPNPLLATNLDSYSMPLIRYEIGDCGTITSKRCSCGRYLPRIDEIQGRLTDFIVTTDERYVSGTVFAHYLRHFEFIREFQVIQTDANHIEIFLVTKRNLNETERLLIITKLTPFLGDSMKIDLTIVDEIEKTPSGKTFSVKSLVASEIGIGLD